MTGYSDLDAVFGTVKFYKSELASPCHKAISLTTRNFGEQFPGWPLYRRLVTGDSLMDRAILSYFIGTARMLARAKTRTGHDYIKPSVRRNAWIEQAATDALDYVLEGKYAESSEKRADKLGISDKTYRKLRDPVALGIRFGLDRWIAELHFQFKQMAPKSLIFMEESSE